MKFSVKTGARASETISGQERLSWVVMGKHHDGCINVIKRVIFLANVDIVCFKEWAIRVYNTL